MDVLVNRLSKMREDGYLEGSKEGKRGRKKGYTQLNERVMGWVRAVNPETIIR